MNSSLKVVLMTGNALRHRYVAEKLGENFNLAGIVCEKKRASVEESDDRQEEESKVIQQHLAERMTVEEQFFGENDFPEETDLLEIPTGAANSHAAYVWVSERQPDYVILYGTSIIKPPLLEAFDGRIVNMHLGLSPYFRGAATNFWPLVERAPEYVGATIHLAVAKVDAGPILAQARPEIALNDRAHEIGCKTIVAGTTTMIHGLEKFHSGDLDCVFQDLSSGRVYRRKDFDANAVRRLWEQFDTGMIPEYLEQYEARCRAAPIRELVVTQSSRS